MIVVVTVIIVAACYLVINCATVFVIIFSMNIKTVHTAISLNMIYVIISVNNQKPYFKIFVKYFNDQIK